MAALLVFKCEKEEICASVTFDVLHVKFAYLHRRIDLIFLRSFRQGRQSREINLFEFRLAHRVHELKYQLQYLSCF